VYRREDISERALFVIDKNGIIHWSYVSPIGVNPGAQGILDALESLQQQKKEVKQHNQKDSSSNQNIKIKRRKVKKV
jgi:alkyl hydroperoxide reductase subunit AhpC